MSKKKPGIIPGKAGVSPATPPTAAGPSPQDAPSALRGGGRSDKSGSGSSTGDPPSVRVALLRTLRHFFPDFGIWLRSVRDGRDPRWITYPIGFELWTALFLFWSKLSARRQIRFQFATPTCLSLLNELAGSEMKRMMAPDTLPYGLARIGKDDLAQIQHALVYRLIRSKSLRFARLLKRHYMIAIDMTGYHTFDYPHCDSCLKREMQSGTIYLHEVLEAKLISPGGMALSVATEFLDKTAAPSNESRQDCELKAFYRLVERLQKLFPQLSICLLLDGLYPVQPVLDRCREYGWEYLITFKEGRAPAAFDEYERLCALGGESASGQQGERTQKFRWLNGLPYAGHPVNVLECQETDRGGTAKRFVWMTNLKGEQANYRELSNQGGRQRWRVENEGFNMQKNGGYGLEHAYSEDEDLMKSFYLLMQIAHTIYQLLEKGLLNGLIAKAFGSIRNVARRFLEEVRLLPADWEAQRKLLDIRIQIRLDTT